MAGVTDKTVVNRLTAGPGVPMRIPAVRRRDHPRADRAGAGYSTRPARNAVMASCTGWSTPISRTGDDVALHRGLAHLQAPGDGGVGVALTDLDEDPPVPGRSTARAGRAPPGAVRSGPRRRTAEHDRPGHRPVIYNRRPPRRGARRNNVGATLAGPRNCHRAGDRPLYRDYGDRDNEAVSLLDLGDTVRAARGTSPLAVPGKTP